MAFDNAEHVSEPLAALVKRVLESQSRLRFLITSRIKVEIPTAHVVSLQPMSLLEGLELFVQSAQRSQSDFELTVHNRGAVIDVVQQLDRLPLAIELAVVVVAVCAVPLHRR